MIDYIRDMCRCGRARLNVQLPVSASRPLGRDSSDI